MYDDYSPSSSQDRSERENVTEDHIRKRRRIETEVPHARNMADPSRLPPTQRRTTLQPHYDYFAYPPQDLPPGMPLGMPVGTLLEEEEALEYLASGSGFAHDLHGMDLSPPSHPPFFLASGQPSQSAALTSHPSQAPSRYPSGYTSFRRLPEQYFPSRNAGNVSVVRRETPPSERAVGESSGSVIPVPNPFDFSIPPPYRAPIYPGNMPVIQGIPPPRRIPVVPTTPPSDVAKKPPTMLILSRASVESIEALEEHKRECPTCCLEFEPDNFLAVVTCCNMAMHARCLSVWVNTQEYSKNRVCMKCRRGIEAKYALNKVMPPVSDKDWDEGGSFDAPESLRGDATIPLNITAKPPRQRSRASMGYPGHRGGRYLSQHWTPEQTLTLRHLQEDHYSQLQEVQTRRQAAMDNQHHSNHEDLEANRAIVDAQTRATQEEMSALFLRCRDARAAQEKAKAEYEKTRAELDSMERAHNRRMSELIEEYSFEREAREREARSISRMEESARSAPIPVPQLRVVNGDPAGSVSP